MSSTFRALRYFNYRLWFCGAIVSNIGTWMQRVAQDWLVLTRLTDESGVAVGITTGLQFLPPILLAPYAGLIVDRVDKRKLLMTTQLSSGASALLLGVLVLTGTAQLWHVYVLAAVLGVATAFDFPARHTFVGEMVGGTDLPNAVSLNSATFNAARVAGPAAAGLLIALVDIGPVFLINALTFLAVVLALTRMRASELQLIPRVIRGKGQIREGLAYIRGRPQITIVMVVVFLVGAFGVNFELTTALMARVEFERGAEQYGLLVSVMAVGSLGGALLAARRERPRVGVVIGAAFLFGVAELVASVMPTYLMFALALIPVGLTALTMLTTANAVVQLNTDPAMRGRVMALYMVILMGGTPMGAPLIGWVGERFGARYTIALGGAVSLIVAVAAAAYLLRSQRLRVNYRLRARPHLLIRSAEVRAEQSSTIPGTTEDNACWPQ
ncbi:MFS transporter [Kribbella qitaiheensis]|uniref:MFS transporter n=1 Tax=Kribbella qitaiheensis TaxID=1544730 RepID=UPI00361794DA